jgi:hypothetical protein
MRTTSVLAVITAALLMTACADQKGPAEQAVSKVEASLAEFKADAQQYAGEQLAEVEKAVGKLKTKLAEQDYSGVLQGSTAVASTVASLKAAVAQKKADAAELLAAAQQEWTELSASVPEVVDRLQKKVDSLVRSKRTPSGMDKASWDSAKADFEKLKASWSEATAEFGSGMAADAVRRARAAKAAGERLAQKLGA